MTCQCTVLTIAHVHTQVVVLEFEGVFEIEDGSGCEFDSLRIIDGTEDFVTVSEKLSAFSPRSFSADR